MKKLYSVTYEYEHGQGNIDIDTWYFAKNNTEEVHKIMEYNRNIFLENEMDILHYSIKEVSLENYDIILVKK